MLLVYLSCTWVAGILLGSYIKVPFVLALAGLVPLPLVFTLRRHRRRIVLACLGIVLFMTAAAYSYDSLHTVNESRLHYYNDGGSVELRGIVAEAPDAREATTRLMLEAAEINTGEGWREVEGTALVFVPRYPEYSYGDLLAVTGEPETPPVLGDFDYRGYLAHRGIHTTMFYPRIEVLDTGQGSAPMAWILSLRDRLSRNLAELLPEPQASLAQGIILGIRGNIPDELTDDFARSGTAHLLAISGLHLGIIAGVMLGIGLWLFGRRHYLYIWLALGAVWLYVFITGMHLPVLRGAVMASLFLFAEALGRQRSAIVALTFAAAVMVGFRPYILGDASFQLSFLAMAGLVFLFPVFSDFGRKLTEKWLDEEGKAAGMANAAVDTLSATLGAVVAVWPVVAYYFGIVSLVAPLATFLTLPALPGVIIAGTLAAVIRLASLVVAQVVGWLAWLFLSYLVVVVGGLASPSVSWLDTGPVSPVFVWCYYGVLAAVLWLYSRRKRMRKATPGTGARTREGFHLSFSFSGAVMWLVLPLLVVAVLVLYAAVTWPDDDLHVDFLDVGEGDAVLIRDGSRQILVDGGPGPGAISLELSERMPFWDRTIDLVVLTHPHHDHLAGLVEVLRRYRVKQVLYAGIDYDSPLYDEWRRLIEEKRIESTAARAGQRIDLGDGRVITVLGPPDVPLLHTESDIDNNSVVLRLSAGGVGFLLTGDIMKEAEWKLIGERADLGSTVLKVGHHGSDTSTTPEFLAVVRPGAAVICCGEDNRHGHPDGDVVRRLEEAVSVDAVYCTAENGTIEFTTDGERLWVVVEGK